MLNLFKNNHKNSLADDEIAIQNSDYFNQRLKLERRRSERHNYYYAIIKINTTSLKSIYKNNKKRFMKLCNNIINTILPDIRSTDVVSYNNHDEIIILLPDTSTKGAHIVEHRIKQILLNKFSIDRIPFKISIFPRKREDNFDKEILLKNESGRDNVGSFDNSNQFNTNTIQHIVSNLVINNNNLNNNNLNLLSNALTIHNPFLLYYISFLNSLNIIFRNFAKRMIDIIGAIILILFFSPFMIFIAIGIKLSSRGPIFFCQQRVGLMGKPFLMLKFRSMKQNSSEKTHKKYIEYLLNNKQCLKNKDNIEKYKDQIDCRTTSLGKFLRKSSLDELPQLINVIKGEMSLVGPRPHPIYEVEKYRPWY